MALKNFLITKGNVPVVDEPVVDVTIPEELHDNHQSIEDEQVSNEFIYEHDPANWIISNNLRDYVSKFGFIQNKDCDLSTTKRDFLGRSLSLNLNHFRR